MTATILRWPYHTRDRRCTCDATPGRDCMACALFLCRTCGGGEGWLPAECPGTRASYELLEMVGAGTANYTAWSGWTDAHGRPLETWTRADGSLASGRAPHVVE